MRFTPLPLPGAFLIELEPIVDERGFFARAWCHEEFASRGLDLEMVQCNLSFNVRRGTLRGLHYQAEPHAETKVVRCVRGRIFDVLVDLRQDSPSFGKWHAEELSADNRRALYVPKGLAHGFQTLEDASEVFYQMSASYHPGFARGVRWDSSLFSIAWPIADHVVISDNDRNHPERPS